MEFYLFIATIWALAAYNDGNSIKASLFEGLLFPFEIIKIIYNKIL